MKPVRSEFSSGSKDVAYITTYKNPNMQEMEYLK